MLRQYRDVVDEIEKLFRSAPRVPYHGRERVSYAYGIDPSESRRDRRRERRVHQEPEGKANIARANRLSVVPARVRIDVKCYPRRIWSPAPRIREPRCESAVANRIQLGPDVSQIIEYLIHHLTTLTCQREWWKQIVGVTRGGDDERAT